MSEDLCSFMIQNTRDSLDEARSDLDEAVKHFDPEEPLQKYADLLDSARSAALEASRHLEDLFHEAENCIEMIAEKENSSDE